MGQVTVKALDSVTVEIQTGDVVVVLGPSGSGKSTFLNIIGGMDAPTGGDIFYKDDNIAHFSNSQRALYRREAIGFVFQFYNLMPNLTAMENVELATEISPDPLDIQSVLEAVGLSGRENHFPAQMSGGEQQRVAIARAIASNPDVLMCDEPTGALDFNTGIQVLKLLRKINREMQKTILIITHNQPIADMADYVIRMRSGKILRHHRNEQPLDPDALEW